MNKNKYCMLSSMSRRSALLLAVVLLSVTITFSDAFTTTSCTTTCRGVMPSSTQHPNPVWKRTQSTHRTTNSVTSLQMAQVSEKEAKGGIDKVVAAIRKDRTAASELGKLTKVNNILGFGSPKPGVLAVRFNASFQKGGMGRSSVPLPFGLGQSNKSEGRGTMVGQVKASINTDTGKLISCSVFRDLGYGRAFEMKV